MERSYVQGTSGFVVGLPAHIWPLGSKDPKVIKEASASTAQLLEKFASPQPPMDQLLHAAQAMDHGHRRPLNPREQDVATLEEQDLHESLWNAWLEQTNLHLSGLGALAIVRQ